jgi:DNA-binding transcriptional MerR regulator
MTLGELLEQVGGDARTAARLAKRYPLSYFLLGLELEEIEKILSDWVGESEKEGKVVPFRPKAVEAEVKGKEEEEVEEGEEEEATEADEEEEELDFGEEAEPGEDFDFDFGEEEEEESEEEEPEPAPRRRGRKPSGVKRGKRGGRR